MPPHQHLCHHLVVRRPANGHNQEANVIFEWQCPSNRERNCRGRRQARLVVAQRGIAIVVHPLERGEESQSTNAHHLFSLRLEASDLCLAVFDRTLAVAHPHFELLPQVRFVYSFGVRVDEALGHSSRQLWGTTVKQPIHIAIGSCQNCGLSCPSFEGFCDRSTNGVEMHGWQLYVWCRMCFAIASMNPNTPDKKYQLQPCLCFNVGQTRNSVSTSADVFLSHT